MKKFIKILFLYFVAFCLINFSFYYLLMQFDWNAISIHEQKTINNQDLDVLFLGNSLSQDGFDIDLLASKGIQAYNFAFGGASLATSYAQMVNFFGRNNKAEIVILGVGDYMENFKKSSYVDKRYLFFQEGFYSNIFLRTFIVFKGYHINLIKLLLSPAHRKASLYKGHLRIGHIMQDNTRPVMNKVLNFHDIRNNIEIMKMKVLCDSLGVKFTVVNIPGQINTRNFSEMVSNDSGELEIINMNCHNCVWYLNPKKDWTGNSHLNQFGARKFTSEFFEIYLAGKLSY